MSKSWFFLRGPVTDCCRLSKLPQPAAVGNKTVYLTGFFVSNWRKKILVYDIGNSKTVQLSVAKMSDCCRYQNSPMSVATNVQLTAAGLPNYLSVTKMCDAHEPTTTPRHNKTRIRRAQNNYRSLLLYVEVYQVRGCDIRKASGKFNTAWYKIDGVTTHTHTQYAAVMKHRIIHT